MVVLIPPDTPSENATPMAIPSAILWIVSPIIIFHATGATVLFTSPFVSNDPDVLFGVTLSIPFPLVTA